MATATVTPKPKTPQSKACDYCPTCRTFHGDGDPCRRRPARFTGHLLRVRHPYSSPEWSKGKLSLGQTVPHTGNPDVLIAMFTAAEEQWRRDANPFPNWPDPRYQSVPPGFYSDVTALNARLRSVVDRKYKFRFWDNDSYRTKPLPIRISSRRTEPEPINFSSPDKAWSQIVASCHDDPEYDDPEYYLFCNQFEAHYVEAPAEAPSRYAPYVSSPSWDCDGRYSDRYPTSLPGDEWLASEASIREELEAFAAVPLLGYEAAWLQLGIAHGVLTATDITPIEAFVEIVHDGRWRESTSIGKYLRATTKRQFEKHAKALGTFWWRADKLQPGEKVNRGPVVKYYGPREKVWIPNWNGERNRVLRRLEISFGEMKAVNDGAEGDGTFGDQRPEDYALDVATYRAGLSSATPWQDRTTKAMSRKDRRSLDTAFRLKLCQDVPELTAAINRLPGLTGFGRAALFVRAVGRGRDKVNAGIEHLVLSREEREQLPDFMRQFRNAWRDSNRNGTKIKNSLKKMSRNGQKVV